MVCHSEKPQGGPVKVGDLERNFIEKRYSDNIDKLNIGLAKLSFTDNMNGQITDVEREILSGEEANIPHNLNGVPIGMLVLRQRGNGTITDGDFEWTPQKITIKNNGPDTVTFLRLFIARN